MLLSAAVFLCYLGKAVLQQRALEFKLLSKKSIMVSFLFFNLKNVKKMAELITVFAHFIKLVNQGKKLLATDTQRKDQTGE